LAPPSCENEDDDMPETVDLYNNVYADFASRAEAAVRAKAFGEDIGQSSWMTAADWLRFADLANVGPASHVLEVGSGSGGPAVYLAGRRGCRVTGVDLNAHGVANGAQLAAARGVADRAAFQAIDASQPLPFPAETFDAVLSNDAMCHIEHRLEVLRDWRRVLRPGGRMLFTDAMIVTGIVSQEEIATRSSIGRYLFVPPGENERLIAAAGFTLLAAEDLTAAAEAIAQRWHDAREQHRDALVAREGEANFAGLQRFLACVHRLSAERRLSRYGYLAACPVR
jgi:cyclopropane fatty-acyl-phospholipid synthase-like methyltransferase